MWHGRRDARHGPLRNGRRHRLNYRLQERVLSTLLVGGLFAVSPRALSRFAASSRARPRSSPIRPVSPRSEPSRTASLPTRAPAPAKVDCSTGDESLGPVRRTDQDSVLQARRKRKFLGYALTQTV